jgi:hypothetical protein
MTGLFSNGQWYKILDIPENADYEAWTKACKKKWRSWHPDKYKCGRELYDISEKICPKSREEFEKPWNKRLEYRAWASKEEIKRNIKEAEKLAKKTTGGKRTDKTRQRARTCVKKGLPTRPMAP